jgi:hypothetical protein
MRILLLILERILEQFPDLLESVKLWLGRTFVSGSPFFAATYAQATGATEVLERGELVLGRREF